MCRWIGSHFHDSIDYNGVAFSIDLLEWGGTFSDFWSKYKGIQNGKILSKKITNLLFIKFNNKLARIDRITFRRLKPL